MLVLHDYKENCWFQSESGVFMARFQICANSQIYSWYGFFVCVLFRSLKRRQEQDIHPNSSRFKIRRHEDQMLVHHDPEEKLDPSGLNVDRGLFHSNQQLMSGQNGAMLQNGHVGGHYGGANSRLGSDVLSLNGQGLLQRHQSHGQNGVSGQFHSNSNFENVTDEDDTSMSDGSDSPKAESPCASSSSNGRSLALIPVSEVMDGVGNNIPKLNGREIKSLLGQQHWRDARESSG